MPVHLKAVGGAREATLGDTESYIGIRPVVRVQASISGHTGLQGECTFLDASASLLYQDFLLPQHAARSPRLSMPIPIGDAVKLSQELK